MPTYGYQCTQCKHEFSVFQNMKDDPVATCPECSGAVKRLLYPVGVVFKGTGWYINDSRKPEKTEAAEKPAAEKTPAAGDSKAETAKPAETTPAASTSS